MRVRSVGSLPSARRLTIVAKDGQMSLEPPSAPREAQQRSATPGGALTGWWCVERCGRAALCRPIRPPPLRGQLPCWRPRRNAMGSTRLWPVSVVCACHSCGEGCHGTRRDDARRDYARRASYSTDKRTRQRHHAFAGTSDIHIGHSWWHRWRNPPRFAIRKHDCPAFFDLLPADQWSS